MNYCENIKCQRRISSCDYPCEPYTDYIINLSLKKNNVIQDKQNKLLPICNDIADFLEYSVEDESWIKLINREIPIIDVLDENAFYEYFESENEKFCKQEGLCPECRGKLVEKIEYEEIWGSRRESERYLVCENRC